jgi:hypothetical protein
MDINYVMVVTKMDFGYLRIDNEEKVDYEIYYEKIQNKD